MKNFLSKKYVFIMGIIILTIFTSMSVMGSVLSKYISDFSSGDISNIINLKANISKDDIKIINLKDTSCNSEDEDDWGVFEIKIRNDSEIAVDYSTIMELTDNQSFYIDFFVIDDEEEIPISLVGNRITLEGLSGTSTRNKPCSESRVIKWKLNNHDYENYLETQKSDVPCCIFPINIKISLITYPVN